MPSTIQLQTTVNWASAFVNFEQLNLGSGNEPAISNANIILSTLYGPPFKWNWNRVPVGPITCIAGTQDYLVSISNFGFLEAASAAISGTSFAIPEIKQELTVGAELGRPKSIAAQMDNNSGSVTFRFLPVPDQAYSVTPYIQQSPTLFSALATVWPVPDKFEYIYSYGFLALSMAYANDDRFQVFNQKFVGHLLGAQQGLTETERNLFLDTWNLIARQEQLVGMKAQQGRAGLGV